MIAMSSMETTTLDERLARIAGGELLTRDEILALATDPDILPVGMLADALRRRLRGGVTTFLRAAYVPMEQAIEPVPSAAREVVLTGTPATSDAALEAIRRGRQLADIGDTVPRTLAAFSWHDVVRIAEAGGVAVDAVLSSWREAGLDAVAEVPIDAIADSLQVFDQLGRSGFTQVRVSVDAPEPGTAVDLWFAASEVQQRAGIIQSLNPLPNVLRAFRPTTGYADVKMVALARLAAPNIPVIQVDWRRYGPKLAQVALTFGADDVIGISPLNDTQEGRRRAPLEEIRRNVEAAGFVPAERDGRFVLLT
jgi:hypothetical protein